jgi:hypothetical protein
MVARLIIAILLLLVGTVIKIDIAEKTHQNPSSTKTSFNIE